MENKVGKSENVRADSGKRKTPKRHTAPEWWIAGEHMPPMGGYCGGAGHCPKCAEEEDRALMRGW